MANKRKWSDEEIVQAITQTATQQAAAERLGCDPAYVSRIVKGDDRPKVRQLLDAAYKSNVEHAYRLLGKFAVKASVVMAEKLQAGDQQLDAAKAVLSEIRKAEELRARHSSGIPIEYLNATVGRIIDKAMQLMDAQAGQEFARWLRASALPGEPMVRIAVGRDRIGRMAGWRVNGSGNGNGSGSGNGNGAGHG